MTVTFRQCIPAAALVLMALFALPGCFTGVERTPVIKDSTQKNSSKVKPSAEQLLMEPVKPDSPTVWQPGKPFLLSGGRLDYAFTPISVAQKLLAGDTVRFSGFRPAVRLSGDSITELALTAPSGEELVYRIELPLHQVINEPTLGIPFTTDVDLVNSARTVLKGKRVWTLKANSSGRKFQPAEISDVLSGNSDYPFRVVLNHQDTLFMVTNTGSSATSRTFANLFTLTDPRKLHPEISDKNWELISQGKVALDMTREECRLAIGAPAQLERNSLPSGIFERWIFEDGVYLIFTDGILTNFRL